MENIPNTLHKIEWDVVYFNKNLNKTFLKKILGTLDTLKSIKKVTNIGME